MADSIRDASMGPELGPDSVQADTIPFSHLPRIRICISRPALPQNIAKGIEEIVDHHIRPDVLYLHALPEPLSASGLPENDNDHASTSPAAAPVPVWNWNVHFQEDASLQSSEWRSSTSSDTFAPNSTSESSETQKVDTPFIIRIDYHPDSPHHAFRALGHILGVTKDCLSHTSAHTSTPTLHPNLFAHSSSTSRAGLHLSPTIAHTHLNITQTSPFSTIGTMIDCSRNGVLNLSSCFFLLRSLALLGYNMLQLYTEDTYEIHEEPFFGFMRGGYTSSELTSIDSYAALFGIEVIPCIQTLGHLGQMLQWPRYLGLRDTAEVLLAELPETYVMLEKMIKAASGPFRSKRIHLGMDETHGLSHGRYYSMFGAGGKTGSQVFVEHLERVREICKGLGLEPMIWSDMLFCLSARNNSLVGYYDSEQPTEVKQQGIPPGVDLVYWDYYHTSPSSYSTRIRNHEELRGASPWLAAGSWTWSRFWTALPFTFQTIRANLTAAKGAQGVKHVFLTIWGDEGNEVDLWSSLPAWVYYADQCYTTKGKEEDVGLMKSKFDAILGGNWDDFVLASSIDDCSEDGGDVAEDDKIHFAPNTSKWMLWSDPVHSFAEPTLVASGFDAEAHYSALASTLSDRLEGATLEDPLLNSEALVVRPGDSKGKSNGLFSAAASIFSSVTTANKGGKVVRILSDHPMNARLELARLLAHTLSLKANLRQRLHQAYASRNWSQLQQLHRRTGKCLEATRKLWRYHRQVWMSMYKPHGWETVELRYGGLVARLDTLYRRVGAFLDHVLDRTGREEGEGYSDRLGESARRAGVFLSTPVSLDDEEEDGSREDGEGSEEDGDEDSMRSGGRRRNKWGWQEDVTSLPELEKPLHLVYGSPEQLLDYHRVSRPTYC